MRFYRCDLRGPHELPQRRSLALVSILPCLAPAEIANALHSRDFRSSAIFEFFNTIRQKMTYRGIGCPRAPVQLFRESIVALGPASFRPTSSVAKLSALGDDSPPDCLLAGIRQSPSSNPRAHTALEDKEKLAHPIRFERVTFAFGGQRSGAQTISWSGRMYARRLSQGAKRNALQRRCEIDPLSGTSCTSVDDNHMSLPRVELDNINQPDDRRLKPARLP